MKLIMATSADGFIARGPDDDMKWSGSLDKLIFKLLTCTSGGQLGAGSTTYDQMPKQLNGRTLHCISRNIPNRSRKCISLSQFYTVYPQGWLIGGQTIALTALEENLIHEVFLVRTPNFILRGIPDKITPLLENWYNVQFRTPNDPNPDIVVDFYRTKDLWGHTY